ncbi:redoxin domain-containing protein [[Phormidium ambiguum] IAM M-71]|uniref:redoxin domain-containing protein n=1 Tax=[Phormidium ambiguum] IAM M-71 TaxID=454136 RepID=UPI000A07963B|nr:redoxin domain-containing protein [Phormidium ambiguum]
MKANKSLLGITATGLFLLLTASIGTISNASNSINTENKNSSSLTQVAASNTSASPSSAGIQSPSEIRVAAASVNKAAPNFVAADTNGKTHRLTDFKGKVVVLEWTNHDCPFVRKHYGSGNMQKLQKELTGKGVVWISIISSAPGMQGYVSSSQANELTKSRNASPTAVILDPEGRIGKQYGARTTPHIFVVGKDGNIKYMGAIDSIASPDPADIPKADNYVRNAVNSVISGKPVADSVTQPYGCSVKYGS